MNENKKAAMSVIITLRSICVVLIAVCLASSYIANAQTQATYRKSMEVFVNGGTTPGFFFGVNTSGNKTDWITLANDSIRMAYPVGQSWGAVFITYGQAANRNSIDLSQYQNVSMTVKGEVGGESVKVGIKDVNQGDGTEIIVPIDGLTTQWKTYEYKLSQFTEADVTKLYVVFEFVFSGSKTQTVYFNNITYFSDPVPVTPTPPTPTPTPTFTITPTPTPTISPSQTPSPSVSSTFPPAIPESTTSLALTVSVIIVLMIISIVLIAAIALIKRRVNSK